MRTIPCTWVCVWVKRSEWLRIEKMMGYAYIPIYFQNLAHIPHPSISIKLNIIKYKSTSPYYSDETQFCIPHPFISPALHILIQEMKKRKRACLLTIEYFPPEWASKGQLQKVISNSSFLPNIITSFTFFSIWFFLSPSSLHPLFCSFHRNVMIFFLAIFKSKRFRWLKKQIST